MKNVIIAITLAIATLTAQARSIDPTPVLAVVSGHEAGIEQVALLADGRLQVKKYNEKVQTYRVSAAVLNRVAGEVIRLSHVELAEETKTIVCRMMLRPTLSNLSITNFNYETQKYEGNLRLILTAQSCSLGHTVIPENKYAAQSAVQLREQLVVLALNTLE